MSNTLRIFAAVSFSVLMFGCGLSERSLAPPEPESTWSPGNIRAHLDYLNAPEAEGRGNGTRGFVRTTTYISTLLKVFGLQPILEQEYRHQYPSRLRVIQRSNIWLAGVDTLQFVRGQDFVVHNQSDPPEIVFSPSAQQKIDGGRYSLIQDVISRETVSLSTVHVSGIVPGRHPLERDSLVWIMAPVDGWGLQGLLSYTDGSDMGSAAAALLEVARRLSEMQNAWSMMGHSVMVSFLSGSRMDCQGPAQAFRTLPWEKSRLKRVIVLEDAPLAPCSWDELAKQNSISAPVSVLSGKSLMVRPEANAPFYPFIRRERLYRSSNADGLTAESLDLGKRAMDLILQ